MHSGWTTFVVHGAKFFGNGVIEFVGGGRHFQITVLYDHILVFPFLHYFLRLTFRLAILAHSGYSSAFHRFFIVGFFQVIPSPFPSLGYRKFRVGRNITYFLRLGWFLGWFFETCSWDRGFFFKNPINFGWFIKLFFFGISSLIFVFLNQPFI